MATLQLKPNKKERGRRMSNLFKSALHTTDLGSGYLISHSNFLCHNYLKFSNFCFNFISKELLEKYKVPSFLMPATVKDGVGYKDQTSAVRFFQKPNNLLSKQVCVLALSFSSLQRFLTHEPQHLLSLIAHLKSRIPESPKSAVSEATV